MEGEFIIDVPVYDTVVEGNSEDDVCIFDGVEYEYKFAEFEDVKLYGDSVDEGVDVIDNASAKIKKKDNKSYEI